MKPEIKQKWIDALRSGEYSQTSQSLKDSQGFCCLGVLCDLYLNEEPNPNGFWKDDAFYYDNSYGDVWSEEYLPEPVMDWAGLNDDNPRVWSNGVDKSICISDLNDMGTSFSQIADVIEKQL